MSISYTAVKSFLKSISEEQGYPLDSLEFVAELRKGGPTVSPGSGFTSDANIVKRVSSRDSTPTYPNLWYDNLGSHHVDFKVLRHTGSEKTPVEEIVFAFQHHVFPGNCRICIHRWVRIQDTKPWSPELRAKMFAFRIAVARAARVRTLVISSGKSFCADENFSAFKKSYSNPTHSIYTIDLQNYTAPQIEKSA